MFQSETFEVLSFRPDFCVQLFENPLVILMEQ